MSKCNSYLISKCSISQRIAIVNDWITFPIYRDIYKDKICNGLTNEQLSEKYDYSINTISNIIKTCDEAVFAHIDDTSTLLAALLPRFNCVSLIINMADNNKSDSQDNKV